LQQSICGKLTLAFTQWYRQSEPVDGQPPAAGALILLQ
jgi:hypothetical protein